MYINSSSVCSTKSVADFTIDLDYGKQICTLSNVSYNNVKRYSSILFNYGTYTSNITFCSINSNYASNNFCIILYNYVSSSNYIIDTCNIINNVGKYTIACYRKTTIQNCCILNNTASLLFEGTSYITIYYSCVEGSLSGIKTYNTTTDSNKFFLNNLKFTKTGEYCYSGIDKVGELKPLPVILNVKTYKNNNYYKFKKTLNIIDNLLIIF